MTVSSSPPAIPRHLLLACSPWGTRLPAARVIAALDRGLRAAGCPPADACPLPPEDELAGGRLQALLADIDLDTRLRAARAVVVGCPRLAREGLAGGAVFEIATRARQGGVPAFALARTSSLDEFDARLLDLQEVLLAAGERTLESAGGRLARLVQPLSAGSSRTSR